MDEAGKLQPKAAPKLPAVVAAALRRGATVLTANQRAAHALRAAYAEDARRSGAVRWSTPEIFAFESWMAATWSGLTLRGAADRMLLNRTQEQAVWRRILTEDAAVGEVAGLGPVDALAEMAGAAWRLLCLHDGRRRLHEAGVTTDSRAFVRWVKGFEQVAAKAHLLPAYQLPAALSAAAGRGELRGLEAGIVLVDFDSIAPAHAELFAALRRAGVPVAEAASGAGNRRQRLYEAADERAELEAAGLWIREFLEANPAATVGVVVPNLEERRGEIARVFGVILGEASGAGAGRSRFEFSLGEPLGETALVATALALLGWALGPQPLGSVSDLLLSPYFGGAGSREEALAVAEFDAYEVREARRLRPELSLAGMVRLMEGSGRRTRILPLLQRARTMQQVARAEGFQGGSGGKAHAEWAESFRKLLEAAGWRAAAESSSLAFQTHRRFESALDELATLDFEGVPARVEEAVGALGRIVRRIIFAPESSDARVQILGPLEVGGVGFEALWFLGMGDQTWPQPGGRTALLPWALQRSLRLPGADAVRDHEAACALTRRIAGSAAEMVFSFAAQRREGQQQRSPVLKGEAVERLEQGGLTRSPRPVPLQLERFVDDAPLARLPDGVTPGGAKVLGLQAACGFRAFAELRAGSSQPKVSAAGMDALGRGIVAHTIMEQLWQRVTDQQELRSLALAERHSLLDECIESGLAKAARGAESAWDRAYLATERKRLRRLLQPWLELELRRPAFSVSNNEKMLRDVPVGPLRLDLRVDRIDETEAGTVILDYKTGDAKPAQWLSERPDAPQLPLYAMVSEEPVAGVAFALLRAGEDLGMKGFADSGRAFGERAAMRLPLREQMEQWRETLNRLAYAFAEGQPVADPKSYPQSCRFCGQRTFCRLDTTLLEPSDDDESSPASEMEGLYG